MESPEINRGPHEQALETPRRIYDVVVQLGTLAHDMARVQRRAQSPDGEWENNAEHSYQLALVAPAVAAEFYPSLDTGVVAEFSVVHDLLESIHGDVPTFMATDADLLRKEQQEAEAYEVLMASLPDHTACMLERYHRQDEPEAVFVRFIDKLLPALGAATTEGTERFKNYFSIYSLAELRNGREERHEKLHQIFDEFHELFGVLDMLGRDVEQNIFPEEC